MNQGNICSYDTNIFESGLTTPLVLISIMFFCRFVDLLCTFMQFTNLHISTRNRKRTASGVPALIIRMNQSVYTTSTKTLATGRNSWLW